MELNKKRLERQGEVERLCAQFSLPELRAGGALLKMFESDYVVTPLSKEEIDKIHEKGFSALHWLTLNLDDEKCKNYLSTVDYYRGHPYNGGCSAWIDDKLTFMYICAGTKLAKYVPDYYFQIDGNGDVLYLPDCLSTIKSGGVEAIIQLLDEKERLAIKSIKGDSGVGFYKAEKCENYYKLNDAQLRRNQLIMELKQLRGYVVTEYLKPNEYFKDWSVGATCGIRYVAYRIDGKLEMFDSFIRFGTKKSKCVDNLHAGGLVSFVNREGYFGPSGYQFHKDTCEVEKIEKHPDTGKEIEGRIPMWEEIKQAVAEFGDWFPQLRYLGFDFVVTDDNRVKLLEINSLSGIDVTQFNKPVKEKDRYNFFGR